MPPMTGGPPALPPGPGGISGLPPIRRGEMPNILVIPPGAFPPGPGDPAGMPGGGGESKAEAPPGLPTPFEPGPWCLGADAICQWFGDARLFWLAGPLIREVCKPLLNIVCLLVGIVLLVGLVAVLFFAFLQPG